MLPLLFSLGLPALAPSIGLGALPTLALSGIGAGLGSFLETGDVGRGIKTGLLAGLSGRLLGGVGGGIKGLEGTASSQAMMSPNAFQEAAKGITAPMSGILGAKTARGLLQPGLITAATVGSMASAAQDQPEPRKSDNDDFKAPMPNPPQKVVDFSGDPLDTSKEKNYFDYIFRPQPDLEYPYIDYGTAQEEFRRPSIDRPLPFKEGGEIEDMNEKDLILESILAIKGMKSLEEAQMILGKFLSENGEEALRDLIDSVKSGEYDDTVARFAAGEKGMVRGPSDGSGKDDKVPATMDNQQDVLLTEGEFVMRQPTTDALTKAYGGGFLDRINEAEKDAPKVLEKMVG